MIGRKAQQAFGTCRIFNPVSFDGELSEDIAGANGGQSAPPIATVLRTTP